MKKFNYTSLLAKAEWMPILGITVLTIIILSIIAPAFLTRTNLFVMLRILSVTAIVAMAQMIVIGLGQMNLAVGAIGGLVGCGFINGALIAYTGINGFIITLATMSIYTGLNYGITESIPFYHMPEQLIAWYDSYLGPIPNIVFIPLVTAALVALFLFRHPWGRYILAVGGNPAAAELSGISVRKTTLVAHIVSGTLASLAGVVSVARLGTAEPTIGAAWLLPSFAAPVIGGAVLAGGHVSVVGTLIAAVMILLLENGLFIARTNPYYMDFFLGLLILSAVVFNRWRTVQTEKKEAAVVIGEKV